MSNWDERLKINFGAGDFPTVFDYFYRFLRIPDFWSALAGGILIYVVGLLISVIAGFPELYLETLIFRHVALAIFLSFSVIGYGKREFISSMVTIRPCFDVGNKAYIAYIRKWMSMILSRRGFWITWLSIAAFAIWGTVSLFYPYPLVPKVLSFLSSVHFREILGPDWFTEPKILKLALLDTVLLIGAMPLSLGFWGGFRLIPILLELSKLPVIPMPGLLLVRLRRPTELFLFMSFIWFALATSSGLVLFEFIDNAFAFILILFISSIGLILFFFPQFIFHALIVQSYSRLSDMAISEYLYLETSNQLPKNVSLRPLLDYCADISEKLKPKDLWVFNSNDIILLLLGQLLSLSGNFLQSFHP